MPVSVRIPRTPVARAVTAALLATAALAPLAAQAPRADERFVGVWRADMGLGAMTVRLAIEIARDTAGVLGGRLHAIDVPGQSSPLRLEIRGDSLFAIVVGSPREIAIRGALRRDTLQAVWRQSRDDGGPQELLLPFTRGALEVARRPQRPVPPFPYTTRELAVATGDTGAGRAATVPATLVVPAGSGPFPVLVLDAGLLSPTWTLVGHPILEVLADQLARAGVATLRTSFATDSARRAAAASPRGTRPVVAPALVRWLATEAPREIARDRIGVLGHGTDGVQAADVAKARPAVAYLVLLAVPALRGDAAFALQMDGVLGDLPVPPEAGAMLQLPKTAMRLVATSRDSTEALQRVDSLVRALTDTMEAATDETVAMLRRSLRQYALPPMADMLRADPGAKLRGVTVPVLALAGAADREAPPAAHQPALKALLADGGAERIEAAVLPGLNHLFQTARTGAVFEYGRLEETFSPLALQMIVDFIRRAPPARRR